MRQALVPFLLLLATPSALAAWTPPQTFRSVADAKVYSVTPTSNLGSDITLRVRTGADGNYRSYLRFDLGSTSVTSARLRLFCTDASPTGGKLYALANSGWSESAITWATQPPPPAFLLGDLRAVSANTWVEFDVSAAVAGGARAFALAGGSTNSAYYSSREGANPPELVVGSGGGGGGGPVAQFSGSPTSGQAPLQTAFTDQSTGQVTSWQWSFGDGGSSSQRSPVHTYQGEGTYTVSLSVSGPGGSNTATKTGYVRVFSGTVHGIWASAAELAALPTSGAAWNSLLSAANQGTSSPSIINQDDDTDVHVMAKALVYARTGNSSYRTQVIEACMNAIGTEAGGRTLALARNLIGYVIAADLVGLPSTEDARFRSWLRSCLTETLDGMTLRSTHEDRPNNWGTHAGASRAAVAVYLGDSAELARCAQVFKGWLGDRSSYAGFTYGDTSWQADPSRPVGINPRGATKQGHLIDGVLPDDQRRAGGFAWPPPKENYVWEALQGAVAQAVILSRQGYATWEWSDQALLRAVSWLHQQCNYPAGGDDTWEPHVINFFYASDFPAPIPSTPGKNVGWTDWTLAHH
jgi:PKD repeat protein